MTIEDALETVAILRQRLDSENCLEVMHSRRLWKAKFVWTAPADVTRINEVQQQLNCTLPPDYTAFLLQVSDGATLYYDVEYGQWGYKILGVDELADAQAHWGFLFEGKWQPHFIPVAEYIADGDILFLDPMRPTKDSTGYAVVDGNAYDLADNWPRASRSFHEWLDHLIVSQGARYWQWH